MQRTENKLRQVKAIAFDIDGDEVEVDTDKLTTEKPMPKALRKMLSGKSFDLE